MSSEKDYIENFDQKFDAVFDVIDLPNLSLFEIIENIKSLTFSVDSDLVQIIIQKKLDYIVSEPLCSCCWSRLHKKYTRKKEIETTIGSMSFDCPYLFCPQCKAYHTPYEDILNLRHGKYQYDVQKVAALLSSKDTYEESADMLNEIYRFGISPDTVHHLAGEVASRVNMVEIIPSSDEIRNIVEQISSKQHRKPIFVFAADGAMAPIRAEDKGIRGYLLDKKTDCAPVQLASDQRQGRVCLLFAAYQRARTHPLGQGAPLFYRGRSRLDLGYGAGSLPGLPTGA